jgi:crossover junction endodeoxyribonuclease RusA
MTTLTVTLPRASVLSSNDRHHWRSAAKIAADLRQVGALASRGITPVTGPVDVVVTVSYPDRRRRDAPNLWPTVKPLIDGMVDAGVLPDDSDAQVRRTVFQAGGERCAKGFVRLHVELVEVGA